MKRKILGLDIRSDAVSAVLLSGRSKETVIEAYEHVAVSEEPAEFINGLAAALETVTANLDAGSAVCAAAFPADRISYRNLQVPFKESKKIRQILPYELEPTLPYAVDDLIIDYQNVRLPDREDHTHLIAATIEKSELQQYLDTLASFNIEPEIVTIGGHPAALYLTGFSGISENLFFADIDLNNVSVFTILSGGICLIRSFPIRSGNAASAAESIAKDIRHTWSAVEQHLGVDFRPDLLVINGCGPNAPEFEKDLSRETGLSVQQTDFLSHTEISAPSHPRQPWQAGQMNNALALALMQLERTDGFNFRKGPFAARKFWIDHKKRLLTTGIIAGLVLLLAFANVALDAYLIGKKLARLDQHITGVFTSTFPDVKKIVDPYRQMKAQIKAYKKNSALTEKSDKHIRAIDILYDISRLIPKETDVQLTRLVFGSESVIISGDTDTFNAVDDIKVRLEKSDFFEKITINSANIDKTDNRIRFKLKVHL